MHTMPPPAGKVKSPHHDPADPTAIAAGIRAILGPTPDSDHVVEIRALRVVASDDRGEDRIENRASAFRANQIERMVNAIVEVDGQAVGEYLTMSPLVRKVPTPWALSLRRCRKGEAAADQHVIRRTRMLIDSDPNRATDGRGLMATDAEHDDALAHAAGIREYLRSLGWPDPVAADTGNGGASIYAIDLPRESDLVRQALYTLAAIHNGPLGTVDCSVHNPARIVRVPGTMNCKGEPTAERPHRRSRLLSVPSELVPVPVQLLEELAARCPESARLTVAVASAPTNSARPASTNAADLDRRIFPYLDRCPPAIQGSNGRTTTFSIAARLVNGFGLSEDQAFHYLTASGWNGRCVPPWSDGELRERVRAAAAGSRVGHRSLLDADRPPHDTHGADFLSLFLPPPVAPAPGDRLDAAVRESLPRAAAVAQADADEAAESDEVARTMRELLAPTVAFCPTPRQMICRRTSNGQRLQCARGCHRDDCPRCGAVRAKERFDSDERYIRRVVNSATSADRMGLFVRVAPDEPTAAELRWVARHGGEYTIVHASGVSKIRHREKEESTCLILDNGPVARVWVVTLPNGTVPADKLGLARTRTPDALRLLGTAYRHPHIDPDAVRQRVRTRSGGWGDDVEREPGNLRVEGRGILSSFDARRVLLELGIYKTAHMADAEANEAHGWNGTAGRSLAISLLLRGQDAPRTPTPDRIVQLGGWWLQAIPADIGDGRAVEQVIRTELWYGPRFGIAERLREADTRDRAEQTAQREAQAIRISLQNAWLDDLRASRAAPVGLVAEALAQPYGIVADLLGVVRCESWEVSP